MAALTLNLTATWTRSAFASNISRTTPTLCSLRTRTRRRPYSSSSSQSSSYPITSSVFQSSNPLELAYDHYPSPSASSSSASTSALPPLVIVHGLYGSKQNWRSLAKAMVGKTGRDVYCLDMRNHGASPHSEETDYMDYASDLSRFIESKELEKVVLIGHSMGGKVAMALSLAAPSLLSKLVSVDMSPAVGAISDEFAKYIDAMKEVEEKGCKDKKEADKVLEKYEPSLPVRQFLLTNYQTQTRTFRIPLSIFSSSLDKIGSFPYPPPPEPGHRKYEGPTMFVKGELSKYLNRRTIEVAERYFPGMRLEVVKGAGHWVHSEKPKEFMELITDFCKE